MARGRIDYSKLGFSYDWSTIEGLDLDGRYPRPSEDELKKILELTTEVLNAGSHESIALKLNIEAYHTIFLSRLQRVAIRYNASNTIRKG